MQKLAIITLMKNHSDLTMAMLDSIYANDDYNKDFIKIYIADTGSSDIEKYAMKTYVSKAKMDVKYIEYNFYNFAKINNDVVTNYVEKDTDLILLINNDIQLINNAIHKVVDTFNSIENVGTVGALLLYPNFKIQHGGIILLKRKFYIFTHLFLKCNFLENKFNGKHETLGNTGAFMLTSYNDWVNVGGLNESYKCCFEDVEYNLQMTKLGRKNVTCYDAVCFHKESSTRNNEISQNDVYRINKFASEMENNDLIHNIYQIKAKQ